MGAATLCRLPSAGNGTVLSRSLSTNNLRLSCAEERRSAFTFILRQLEAVCVISREGGLSWGVPNVRRSCDIQPSSDSPCEVCRMLTEEAADRSRLLAA